MQKVITFLFVIFASISLSAQLYSGHNADSVLSVKAKKYPELNSKINISVSNVSLEEFLRAIAVSNKVNIDVDGKLSFQVVNNFTGVTVKDMLAYLCKQYNLSMGFTGNIITITQGETVAREYIPQDLNIIYDTVSELITFNFRNDSLLQVAKQITQKSNKNVVISPKLHKSTVSCYIQNQPLENAIDKLAFSNNLKLTKSDDGFYMLDMVEQEATKPLADAKPGRYNNNSRSGSRTSSGKSSNKNEVLQVRKLSNNTVKINAENCDLSDLVKKVSDELNKNYFIVSNLESKSNLSLESATYEEILNHVFDASKYGFKKSGSFYVIGDRSALEIKESRSIVLQNRSVKDLLEQLPEEVATDLNVKEFAEMNSLLVNGNHLIVDEFERFINEIDIPVPVILIEVVIAYINKTKEVSTGLNAGLGEEPVSLSGKLNPGLDVTLSSDVLGNILNSMGAVNMSDLHPNFYMQLQALESQGFLDIKSTPKLSTISGHEASLSIGNSEYYQEEQTQIIGTQNPQTNTTTTYKSVTADLSVTILPIVSGKENITMEIEVSQSDFTERISKFAPPNTVNRNFKSLIRVKNGEIILLGGLEEAERSESASGWPLLSRIPVVKWFFSSRSRKNSDSKLTVFIKPTILP